MQAENSDLAAAAVLAAVRRDESLKAVILNPADDTPPESLAPPPYLAVRKGLAFWVETRPLRAWTATQQAFLNGCFDDAYLLDCAGNLWNIVDAKLTRQPGLVYRLLPGKQLPVNLEICLGEKPAIGDILADLAGILGCGGWFSENLESEPAEILKGFQAASTTAEIIEVARRLEGSRVAG